MNSELVAKTQAYQNEVNELASYLFHAFYFDEEEQLELALSLEEYKNHVFLEELLLDKGEKILAFFESAKEAKKTFKFLLETFPDLGLEVLNRL